MSYQVNLPEELEEQLREVIWNHYMGEVKASAPIHEIRAQAETAGRMMARVLCSFVEGPIKPDYALFVRYWESEAVKECLEDVMAAYGPDGSHNKK